MRWFFLLLLVINLGVLLWGSQLEMNSDRYVQLPKPGVGNLRLWSEVQPSTVVGVEPEVAVPVEAEAVVEEQEPVTEMVAEEVAADEEPITPEIALETVAIAVLESEEEVAAKEVVCFTLGFLESRDAADEVAAKLADLDIEAVIQDELVQINAGYWVVIPPLPTDEESRQMVRDIKAAGIRDVWRFTGGEKKNAISLGLFSNRANADKAKQRAVKKGFRPDVSPRFRDKQHYWLEFSSVKEAPLPAGLLKQLEAKYPGVELIAKECHQIATRTPINLK